MCSIASQITSITIVYSAVYSGADQRKHQSSASLAFMGGIHRGSVNSPHKWSVTRKMFPFDDVIMRVYSYDLFCQPRFVVYVTSVISICVPSVPGLGSEDEVRLVMDLFEKEGYNPLIRPVRNLTQKVNVHFGLAMIQLINVVSTTFLFLYEYIYIFQVSGHLQIYGFYETFSMLCYRWCIQQKDAAHCVWTSWLIKYKMPSYQFKNSHCGDKTILRLSYFHNVIFYTGRTISFIGSGPLFGWLCIFSKYQKHQSYFTVFIPKCPYKNVSIFNLCCSEMNTVLYGIYRLLYIHVFVLFVGTS